MTFEEMFKGPKTEHCFRCQELIPECMYKNENSCYLPDSEYTEVEPCEEDCPLALCFSCRVKLRRQIQLLSRIDRAIEAEAVAILVRPYKREFICAPDGISASMPELPGCFSCTSLEEGIAKADANLQEAAILWVSAVIEEGEEIPAPEAGE